MGKFSLPLAKVVKVVTLGPVVASLMLMYALAEGWAFAQSNSTQSSPTMQRLQQLQKVEWNRQSAEDAKWRNFPEAKSAYSSFARAMDFGSSPKCQYYWPGWKLQANGTRTTKVRGCRRDWVAVDCKSLKVSWHSQGIPTGWSNWRLPATHDLETTEMVAELCDSIESRNGIKKHSQSFLVDSSARPNREDAVARGKLMPAKSQQDQVIVINAGKEGDQILGILNKIGVKSIIARTCPKVGAIAAYSRFDNLFVLCKDSLSNPALTAEAIAHEAVHVLQDCLQLGGIKGSNSIAMSAFFNTFDDGKQSAGFRDLLRRGFARKSVSSGYLEELKQSMPRYMFEMEVEAYALETSPRAVRILLEALSPLCSL
jgi:hypothetical protein